MSKNLLDPWTLNPDGSPDPFAANIDWNMPDLPDLDHQYEGDPVIESREGLEPEIVVVEGGVRKIDPEPIVEPEPEPDGPEVYEVDDGTVTLEKERGQWKATLTNNTGGNPQVYWGKNKNELLINAMKAQLNATKKIRELNAKVKFGNTPPAPVKTQKAPQPVTRNLTADEIFEIKTQLESDPALALDNLFQKRTGLTIEQLVSLAQQGAAQGAYASNQLISETANQTFLQNNPDYFADASSQNHRQLIRWIAKFRLGEVVNLENAYSIYDRVISSGFYTAENLEEAFEDLKSDGLMIQAPRQPKQASHNANTPPPVVVQNSEPAPAPRPDSRIVKQETRPRAALGIGRNDVTPVKPPEQNAPSAEDLDSMSDEQISALLHGVQKMARASRR